MDLYFTQIDPPDTATQDALTAKGWTCCHLPFRRVRFRKPEWDPDLWPILLITSKQAARWYLKQKKQKSGLLPRLAVVGEATSSLFPAERLLCPEAPANAEQLAKRVRELVPPGAPLLFLRGAIAKTTLAHELNSYYVFEDLIVYETKRIKKKGEAPTPGSMVYFQAPSTVTDYSAHFKIQPDYTAVIGPSTERAVQRLGWTIHFQPCRPENRQFIEELPSAQEFSKRERHS